MTNVTSLLAYRPFIDPLGAIDLHTYWWILLLPLAFGISVVYKAVRAATLDHYWRSVGVMTGQIIAAMVLLAIAAYLFVEVYVGSLSA